MKSSHLFVRFAACFAFPFAAEATPYYVNNCGHDTNCNGQYAACWSQGVSNCAKKSIQGGVDATLNDLDVVHVAAGTYQGASNRNIQLNKWPGGAARNINLFCDGAIGACVIDPQGVSRAFNLDYVVCGQLGREAEVRGFKITNGDGAAGGAIDISFTSPTIRNCLITANSGKDCGAILVINGSNPLIENCTLTDNNGAAGGGICVMDIGGAASAEIRNCTIGKIDHPNHADFGGGGGVFVSGQSSVIMANTRVEGNTSRDEGAGIRVEGDRAEAQMANCVIAKNSVNSSADDGGGIAVLGSQTQNDLRARARLMNCIVVGNSARKGGGIFVGKGSEDPLAPDLYSQVEFVNSVLYGNTASATNGGHEVYFAPIADIAATASGLRNAIIWKTGTSGKSVERVQGKLTIEESDVKDLSSLQADPPDFVLSDNIDGDPLFIDPDGNDNVLGTLDDNFRLQSSSPCRNNGDRTLRLEDFADLDGNGITTAELTPLDLDLVDRVLGSEIDMGAYEFDGCSGDEDCDNGDPCDGVETCESGHCVRDLDDCNLNGIDDFCDITVNHTSEDCDANGVPDDDICQPGPQPIVMLLAVPAHEHSLWRSQKNIARLTFACDISAPSGSQVLIQEMLADGAFGSNLSSGFTFTAENGTVLKIKENASTLVHRKWYAIRNTGGWSGVANFEVQYVVQAGDANDDGRVLFTDLALINTGIPTDPAADNDRRDINGDGKILSDDMDAAYASIPSDTVTEPTGHEPP